MQSWLATRFFRVSAVRETAREDKGERKERERGGGGGRGGEGRRKKSDRVATSIVPKETFMPASFKCFFKGFCMLGTTENQLSMVPVDDVEELRTRTMHCVWKHGALGVLRHSINIKGWNFYCRSLGWQLELPTVKFNDLKNLEICCVIEYFQSNFQFHKAVEWMSPVVQGFSAFYHHFCCDKSADFLWYEDEKSSRDH